MIRMKIAKDENIQISFLSIIYRADKDVGKGISTTKVRLENYYLASKS